MRELDRLVPELLVLERRLELLPDGRELLAEPAPADQKGHEPARGAATPAGEGAGWDGALRPQASCPALPVNWTVLFPSFWSLSAVSNSSQTGANCWQNRHQPTRKATNLLAAPQLRQERAQAGMERSARRPLAPPCR